MNREITTKQITGIVPPRKISRRDSFAEIAGLFISITLLGCQDSQESQNNRIHDIDYKKFFTKGDFQFSFADYFNSDHSSKEKEILKLRNSYRSIVNRDTKDSSFIKFYKSVLKHAMKVKLAKYLIEYSSEQNINPNSQKVKTIMSKLRNGSLIYKDGKIFKPGLNEIKKYCDSFYYDKNGNARLPFHKDNFFKALANYATQKDQLKFKDIYHMIFGTLHGDIFYDQTINKLIHLNSDFKDLDATNFKQKKVLQYLQTMGHKILDKSITNTNKALIIVVGDMHFRMLLDVDMQNKQDSYIESLSKHALATAKGREGIVSPFKQVIKAKNLAPYPARFTRYFDDDLALALAHQAEKIVEELNLLVSEEKSGKQEESVKETTFTKAYGLESEDHEELISTFGFISYSIIYDNVFQAMLKKLEGREILKKQIIKAKKHFENIRYQKLEILLKRLKNGKYGTKAKKAVFEMTTKQLQSEMFIKEDTPLSETFDEIIVKERNTKHVNNFVECLEKDKHKVGILRSGAGHLPGTVKAIQEAGYNYIVIDNPLIEVDNQLLQNH